MAGSIVFGGAGFIGTHLLRELRSRGVQPLVSADIADPAEPVEGVDYRHCDVRQAITLDGNDIDTVYNLAGLVATPGHPDADYLRTNVTGAITVTDWADWHGIRTIVFTSTMSIYPTGEDLKTEAFPVAPTNAYGYSKHLGESIHKRWQRGHRDNRLVITRPAVIFGPGERGNFARMYSLVKRGLFVFPGRKDTIKSCGYVGDLVRSFDFVLGLPGALHVYNFAYPDRCTIAELTALVGAELGKPPPQRMLPMKLMSGAAVPFEGLEAVGLRTGVSRTRIGKLVESTNIYPEFLLEQGFEYPTTLAEGVHRWIESIRATEAQAA